MALQRGHGSGTGTSGRVIRINGQEGPDAPWTVEIAVRECDDRDQGLRTSFPFETLLEAIRTVAGGLPWQPPHESGLRIRTGLSDSECRVARLAALGLRNSEIAGRLFLSHGTVRNYLYKIYRKLGLRNRAELTRCTFSLGHFNAGG